MSLSIFDLPFLEPTVAKHAAATPVPAKLPEHVKRRLEAMGLMDPDTGATRRARARHCERCKKVIMRGIDRDWGGVSVDCDRIPLTAQGELEAIMRNEATPIEERFGQATYDLSWHGGSGYQLDGRRAEHIRLYPPGKQDAGTDILARHICNAPKLSGTQSAINDSPPPIALADKCPF